MRWSSWIAGAAALVVVGCQAQRTVGGIPPGQAGSPPLLVQYGEGEALRGPDVVYVPTQEPVVAEMLRMAGVARGDVVYDLGCGDGRIVIAAARDFGARGVGIDIDPERIAEATANVEREGVGDRVEIRHGDLFEADLSEATVVTLYLLQSLNERLKPKLLSELRPGSRIVSQSFDMGDWEPEVTRVVDGTPVYLWIVP